MRVSKRSRATRVARGKDSSYRSVTAASLALAEESLAGLTLQALGVGLLRAAQRRVRGFAETGTRRLPLDPDARTWRDLVGRLTEGRAAGQQGQDSDDGKDSTDFHYNVPLFNRIRRPARRMTASEAPACLGNARQRRKLRIEARKPLLGWRRKKAAG